MELRDRSKSLRNERNKIRKTQRQPKDTPATNWKYGDLYDAVPVPRRC